MPMVYVSLSGGIGTSAELGIIVNVEYTRTCMPTDIDIYHTRLYELYEVDCMSKGIKSSIAGYIAWCKAEYE